MANVADSNSWRSLALSNSQSQPQESQLPITAQEQLPDDDSPVNLSTTALPATAIPDLGRETLLTIAAKELAERALVEPRLIATSTSVDPGLLAAWQRTPQQFFHVEDGVPHALQWCANLAAEGNRPFAFLSAEELQNSFGQVRQEVCLKRAAVTLIVEARPPRDSSVYPTSASLAAVRQLPNSALLSPKDDVELSQMLDWCLAQQDPAVVWLPLETERRPRWNRGPAVQRGKAEQLTAGTQVAVVAWGALVGAACAAADILAQHGIGVAVINARFAQPLDTETMLRVTRDALCVVLVDDDDSPGGFSIWVLEHLLRHGVTQPITIVSPQAGPAAQHRCDLHKQCALQIVERCRWLADPATTIEASGDGQPVAIVPNATPAAAWLEPSRAVVARVHDEHRQVLAQQLSPFIEHWVREYMKVGERGVYLWRWCLHGLGLTTLSCVAPALRRDHCETKLLAVMYGVMLDDVADQGGDEDFLGELIKIISGAPCDFQRFSARQQQYALFTVNLWEAFEKRLKGSPCHAEFEELLNYDHRQILNTMAYSSMVNRYPAILNVQEHDMYLPHNMQMMSFATMDLMCSLDFDRRELGKLREVIWHAQSMGRIGNLVSTWQREIADRDFTSGVFARAVLQGDLTVEDLRSAPPHAIEAAIRRGEHETYFLQQWEYHRTCIQSMQGLIRSVDVQELLTALERLIHMELSSRGFK